MPIEGRFYTLAELYLYWTEPNNKNPASLPVRTNDHPDGATWAQLEAEHDAVQAAGVGDDI